MARVKGTGDEVRIVDGYVYQEGSCVWKSRVWTDSGSEREPLKNFKARKWHD